VSENAVSLNKGELHRKFPLGFGDSDVPSIEFLDVSLNFGDKVILDRLSLSLPPGAKLSLMGESSCGKSTILKVMLGLIPPREGKVRLFGKDLDRAAPSELDRLRRRVGMQFQAGAMFDSMSVGQNLRLASKECSRSRDVKPLDKKDIKSLLEQVGLGHALKLKPSELSGGMRKRAAIARALVANPDFAIFDEPTAGLDPVTASLIINLLRSLSDSHQATMIVATSDVDVARRFSSDLFLIHQGRLRARGPIEALLQSQDEYVVKFLHRFRLTLQQPEA
jgi:phospholipid/cholesterol/gamma-HCH transport system ATP-binding protein